MGLYRCQFYQETASLGRGESELVEELVMADNLVAVAVGSVVVAVEYDGHHD